MKKFLFLRILDTGEYSLFGFKFVKRPFIYFGIRSGISILLLNVCFAYREMIREVLPGVTYELLFFFLLAIMILFIVWDHLDYQKI